MITENTSQAEIDQGGLEEFFQPGFTHRVIDSLPEYIPVELKTLLKGTHVDPPVEFVNRMPKNEVEVDYDIPPKYLETEESKIAYEKGINMLNEITTDSLTIETVLIKYPLCKKLGTRVYDKGIDQLWKSDQNKDRIVGLFQHLHIANLTGDWDDANYYLKENYEIENIHELAYHIGAFSKRIDKIFKQDKQEPSVALNYQYNGGYRMDNQKIFLMEKKDKQALRFLNTGIFTGISAFVTFAKGLVDFGNYNFESAGISITTGLVLTLISIFALQCRKTAMTLGDNETRESLYIHELLHHISSDKSKNRFGFIFVKEKKK